MNFMGAFDVIEKGGWVAWTLAALSLFLWYSMGDRFLFLRSQSQNRDPDSLTAIEYYDFIQQASFSRQAIKSIVIVAPLLGLLGTVIGMIETFESLQDSALFSQSGGIAGGISQALITTQMGLVVAIPGLLIGQKLDKKEQELTQFGEQALGPLDLQGEIQ